VFASWLMILVSNFCFWSIAVALLIPITVFVVECLAGLAAPAPSRSPNELSHPPHLRVLVPAHNEADHILLTIHSLMPQVLAADNIIVIADNCTDQTADIARSCGVTVLERYEPQYPGKGYALDYALQRLHTHPPEIIIIIDADCWVAPGTISQLVYEAVRQQRPIQATYLMEWAEPKSLTTRISAFAIKVRNLVRSVGITQLGCPCMLAGSGMAFPWDVLQDVSLAGSLCVDDMQLTIDLAIAGHTTTYTTAGKVIGRLMQNHAAQSQRSRWEHGHLQVIATQVPKLLWQAWRQQRFALVMLALDLSVPPLSLLVILWILVFSLSLVATLVGILSWSPTLLLGLEGSLLGLALGMTWLKFGRRDLPLYTLLGIPFYILWKLPIYLNFLIQPQTQWLKTERDIEPTSAEDIEPVPSK